MIKSVRDFIKEEMKDSVYREYTPFQVEQLLIKYGRSIVDECSSNFECEMEESEDSCPQLGIEIKHPVLVRSSVLAVKSMIKQKFMENVERVADLIYGLRRDQYIQILQKWANEIIDECAKVCITDDAIREDILNVKQQIQ